MKPKNFYEILNVSHRDSSIEIKNQYFKLVKQYHPDHNKDPKAEDKFKEIVKAYETLKDPVKRQLYDLGNSSQGDGYNYNDAGQGFSAGGSDNRASYYEKQETQQYYNNKWYDFTKPSSESQREEFEHLKKKKQKFQQRQYQQMDYIFYFTIFRRVIFMLSVYALFDAYRIYAQNRHISFLNTQQEILRGQLIVNNKNLEEYIEERRDLWDQIDEV